MTGAIGNNNLIRSHCQTIFYFPDAGPDAICITAAMVSATEPETVASEMVKIIKNVGGKI